MEMGHIVLAHYQFLSDFLSLGLKWNAESTPCSYELEGASAIMVNLISRTTKLASGSPSIP